MRVDGLVMLFCVFVLWNLGLLTHPRHRRQEIDARDTLARERIYKPPVRTRSSSSRIHLPCDFPERAFTASDGTSSEMMKLKVDVCLSVFFLFLKSYLASAHVQSRDLLLLVFPTLATKK